MSVVVSQRLDDGDTVFLPADVRDIGVSRVSSGFHNSVWLHAVGEGDETEYRVSITTVSDGDTIDSDAADYSFIEHVSYQEFVYIELSEVVE